MANKAIYFEQPITERTRTVMRVEHLFNQIDYNYDGNSEWETRAIISDIIDLLNIFGRIDLKAEILKDIKRHLNKLSLAKDYSGVHQEKLGDVLASLERLSTQLYQQKGQPGSELRTDEFLMNIMKRSNIPGGTCAFDLPAYHNWLQATDKQRKKRLDDWLQSFTTIKEAIDLTLHLTRNSCQPSKEIAQNGFFQENTGGTNSCQLIRVAIAKAEKCYFEISAGKHRYSMRVMTLDSDNRYVQADRDIHFDLYRCDI